MTMSDLMYATYDRSDEQHVLPLFLRYFRHTAFVFSLLHRISLLKLRLSTADPRDIKAPWPHLLPVNGIKTAGMQD